ncbi:hypothetical protein FOVG_16625 [Fusarium oxysporum f. sp. pisi HDV247]|uniref:Uncharacterized protein n=1 Tax=Fusarium oxysporum f. sp. pisi HDV247 TaxID=1080344 RepID=W9NHH3_FUSOX|nr:hypothetical protein FOVG_16625 [Fusarium oxysporum f. sp. pisi HDV247]
MSEAVKDGVELQAEQWRDFQDQAKMMDGCYDEPGATLNHSDSGGV